MNKSADRVAKIIIKPLRSELEAEAHLIHNDGRSKVKSIKSEVVKVIIKPLRSELEVERSRGEVNSMRVHILHA